MNDYLEVEKIIAAKYERSVSGNRKDIGDFMLSEYEAVNVKSNNIHKNNYSPNMVSAKKVYDYLMRDNLLYFIFVDYEIVKGNLSILEVSDTIPANYIDWSCLSIQCQGNGVIQRSGPLKVINQSVEDWLIGLKKAYSTYIEKERKKLDKLENYLGI
jgi:hypothetical protein